jgi:hypothetical protein
VWVDSFAESFARMDIERCACGHLPVEHLMAADTSGPGIYHCEASTSRGRTCSCSRYSAYDPEIDAELPWRAA